MNPLSSYVVCTICCDTKRGPVLKLDCQHTYHRPCLREYLRTLRRVQPDAPLPCPNCRTFASDTHTEMLWNERRCLSFRYIFPSCVSMNPNLQVRVVIRPVDSEQILMRGNTIKVSDLPQDPDNMGRKFLIEDFEVVVQDPETKFSVWVEHAANEFKISRIHILGTTPLETEEEENEVALTSEVEEEQPGPLPVPPPRTEPRNLFTARSRTLRDPVAPENRLWLQYRKRYIKLLQAQQRIRRLEISLRKAQENAHRALHLVDDALEQMFPHI